MPCAVKLEEMSVAHRDISFMEGPSNQQNNIVDHVSIGAVIHERAQRFISLHSHAAQPCMGLVSMGSERQILRLRLWGRSLHWRACGSSHPQASQCTSPQLWWYATERPHLLDMGHSQSHSATEMFEVCWYDIIGNRNARHVQGVQAYTDQMELNVLQCFALAQIVVVRRSEKS